MNKRIKRMINYFYSIIYFLLLSLCNFSCFPYFLLFQEYFFGGFAYHIHESHLVCFLFMFVLLLLLFCFKILLIIKNRVKYDGFNCLFLTVIFFILKYDSFFCPIWQFLFYHWIFSLILRRTTKRNHKLHVAKIIHKYNYSISIIQLELV